MSLTAALKNKNLEKHCIRERKRKTCRSLQGKKKLINQMYNNIKAFTNKLRLWEFQWCSNNMACILTLRMEKPIHTKISTLYKSGSSKWILLQIPRLQTTSGNFQSLNIICCKYQNRPTRISIGIIQLQCDKSPKHKFHDAILLTYHTVIYFQCSDTMHNKEPVWRYLYFWTVIFKCE